MITNKDKKITRFRRAGVRRKTAGKEIKPVKKGGFGWTNPFFRKRS